MDLQKHLRNTFLAGAFAVMPIAATAFIIWYVESTTRRLFGAQTPFAALLLATAAVYVLGLVVRSIVGKVLIGWVDRVLSRIRCCATCTRRGSTCRSRPAARRIFARAVLIGRDTGGRVYSGSAAASHSRATRTRSASSSPTRPPGRRPPAVRRAAAEFLFLDVSMEEAFKSILSTGNYVPPGVVGDGQGGAAPAVDGLVRT